MKRLWLSIFLISASLMAQSPPYQLTPNIGLQIPPYGSPDWQVPFDYNFYQLDLFLSGNLLLPSIQVGHCSGCGNGGNENLNASPAPVFSLAFTSSRIPLNQNITTFTLPAGVDGQTHCINFAHDGTSNPYTINPPSNVLDFMNVVGSKPNSHSHQCFTYYVSDTAWVAQSSGVIN